MKSIKILTVGNSYSNDACAWLEKILKSASYEDVVIGYINYGGCNVNNHWSNVDEDTTNDFGAEFFVNYNGTFQRYPTSDEFTLSDGYKFLLSLCEWDYVIIQHGPKHVEIRETYSHLPDLLDFVKKNLKSPKAKLLYHMIWKYNDNVEGGSTAACYADIIDITKNIAENYKDFVGVIPAATMRQNMMSSYLTDKDISRDYGHMGLGFGRYALGLLWYSYLTGGSPDDISFVPKISDVSEELLARYEFDEVTEDKLVIAKEAIANALAHPYEITASRYTPTSGKALVMGEVSIDEHTKDGERLE